MSFQSLRFYVKSVCRIVQLPIWNIGHYLREINIGEFRSWKKYVFVIFRDLNFVNMVNISLLKVQKFTRIKIQSLQNWFHVKSVWQKNPEISMLCCWVKDIKNPLIIFRESINKSINNQIILHQNTSISWKITTCKKSWRYKPVLLSQLPRANFAKAI